MYPKYIIKLSGTINKIHRLVFFIFCVQSGAKIEAAKKHAQNLLTGSTRRPAARVI